MSSIGAMVTRKAVGSRSAKRLMAWFSAVLARALLGGLALSISAPVQAQDEAPMTTQPEAEASDTIDLRADISANGSEDDGVDAAEEIDLRVSLDDLIGPEAPYEECTDEQEAAIISGEIIVCRRQQDQRKFRTLDPEGSLARFAEETAFRDDPKTPDFISDCHDQGWPAGCVRFGSVPEPALIIDVAALPQAPPGSDADRIARGLPPLGQDDIANGSMVPVGDGEAVPINLGEAEAPEAQP